MVFKRLRSTSNLLGILFSSVAIVILAVSIVFFALAGDYRQYGYITLFSSLSLNYLITIPLSLTLINSQTREDLFINFYLFVFLLFPFLGIFFYFLLGFDTLNKEQGKRWNRYMDFCSRYMKYGVTPYQFKDDDKDFLPKPFMYNFSKYHMNIHRNVNVVILEDAYQLLKEITLAISKAKRYVHMEFYMYTDGLIFEHLFQLLEDKIKEGVEVRLIIDYVGNFRRLKKSSLKRLRAIGVEVRYFNPFFRFNHLWFQFRNHNKVVIVDNECALFGSCNIADEYFNITKEHFQTTELSAKLTGSIVDSVSAIFLTHWDLSNREKDRLAVEFTEEKCRSFFFKDLQENGVEVEDDNYAQFLDDSPIGSSFMIRDNLMQLVFGATKSIVISTPYFYPPKELLNALKLAKSGGVSVRILVPKNPDLINFFSTLNRQSFKDLVVHGIEVYEYFGFNHEKAMVIDGEVAYFGSYNWDYRSLYLNFENALLVRSEKVAQVIENFMDRQFKNSHKINISDIKKSKGSYFFSSFIRLFKPFL